MKPHTVPDLYCASCNEVKHNVPNTIMQHPFPSSPFLLFFQTFFSLNGILKKDRREEEEGTANLLYLNCFHFLGVKDNDIVVRLYFAVFHHLEMKTATLLLKQPPNVNSYHYALVFFWQNS